MCVCMYIYIYIYVPCFENIKRNITTIARNGELARDPKISTG